MVKHYATFVSAIPLNLSYLEKEEIYAEFLIKSKMPKELVKSRDLLIYLHVIISNYFPPFYK